MDTQTAFAGFRKSSGLTLDSTADLFKVDRTTILRWERGDPPVPVKRLDEFERITGIPRHDLRPDIFPPEWQTVPVKGAPDAKVDDVDFERVSARNWYAVSRDGLVYAESAQSPQIMMHRFILGAPSGGVVIDHINGDPLDNRRSNLRICSQRDNARNCRRGKNNKSGFKGVSWKADIGKWRARIMVDRKEISLGAFNSAEEAAKAYDAAAVQYFGQFARLNFGPAPTSPKEGKAA